MENVFDAVEKQSKQGTTAMERDSDILACDDKQRRMINSARRQRMTTVEEEDSHYDDVAKAREEVE